MTKYQCSTEYCCGQFHEWPEIVPCPKCVQTEHVSVWEAWGHPNGELFCEACLGFHEIAYSPDNPYWTWHMQDGLAVIQVWKRSEAEANTT